MSSSWSTGSQHPSQSSVLRLHLSEHETLLGFDLPLLLRGCSSTHLPHPSSSESLCPSLAPTKGCCYSHKHRASTPLRHPREPNQPLDAVPEGFPRAILTIPLCPHRHVPVINAIPCGTDLLSFGQLDPTCELALEAAGNGAGLPGMSCLKAWSEHELTALSVSAARTWGHNTTDCITLSIPTHAPGCMKFPRSSHRNHHLYEFLPFPYYFFP